MAAVELATGYVSLAIETSQVAKGIGSMFKGADTMAGKTGKSMGQALKGNFEDSSKVDLDGMRKSVDVAEARITATIERNSAAQAKAKRAVEIAEAELEEKRNNSRTSASQLMKAEDKLTLARQKSEAASVSAKSDLEKYNKELAESKTALQAAERAAESAAKGTSSAFSGIGAKIKKGLSGDLSGAFDGVAKRADFVSGRVKEEFGVTSEAIGAALKGDFRNAFQTLSDQGASASRRLKGDLSTAFSGVRPDAAKAADAAEREFKDAGDDAGRGFSDGFKDKLKGALAGAVAYIGISELTQGIGAAVKEAGDFEQSVGAVQSVFKDTAGEMFRFAETASTSVGLSKNAYQELATVLGAQLKNGGMALDEIGGKTNELVGLGADLASMFGGSTKESVEALSSALKGERDPIERYGVSLNQAKIDAEAASMGFEKVGNSLSAEATQAATLSLIMKQTQDAHGNFAKEADTFAGKQQRMAAQWEDMKVKIGDLFIPALTSAMGLVTNVALPAIGGLTGGLRDAYEAVAPVGEWLNKTKGTWGPFAAGIALVAGAYGAWTLATKIQTAALWGQAAAFIAANAPIVAVVAGLGLLVGAVISAYQNIGWFKDAVNAAWSFIRSVTVGLVSWFVGTAFPAIVNAVRVVGNAFSWLNTNVIQPVWSRIRSAISAVAGWFTGTIVPNFNKSINALGKFFDFLYRNFIAPFVFAFKLIINTTLAWFRSTIVPAFKAALNVLGAAFRYLYDKVIKPVWDWIRAKIRAVFDWFNVERAKLQGRLRILGDAFKALYNASVKPAFDWIRSKATAVWGALRDHVFAPMRSGLTRLQDAFTAAKNGIGTAWDKLKAKVKEPIAFVVNKVINPFIGGYNKLNNFWSGDNLDKITGFARGGWTGPGSKYQEAGVVHADEFVIRKESQRDLSRTAPGLLDGLNKYGSKALGYANGGVVAPLKGKYPLTQGYNRVHKGIDIGAPSGTPLYATANGRVTHAGPGARAAGVWGGNEIHVASGGLERWFAHLSQIMVRQGQMVKAGQMIGRTGNTGISSGPHLHMGVFRGGWPNDINPLSYLGGAIKFDQNAPGGGGGIDPLGWIKEKLDKHITGPMRNAKERFASNKFAQMPLGIAAKAFDSIKSKAADLASPFLNGVDEAVKGVTKAVAGVGDRLKASKWMGQALRHTGDWSLGNQNAGVRRMDQESGFDPNAVNNWDSNAKNGTPSKGLMQVIGPTFSQYRDRSLPNNILDPIANIVASINYTKSRYGSLTAGWNRAGGYADGGLVQPGNVWDDPVGTVHKLPQGVSSIYNGTGGAEYFQRVNPDQPTGGLNIHGDVYTVDETQFANKVFRKMDQRRSLAYVA